MDTNKTRHLLYMYYFYAILFIIIFIDLLVASSPREPGLGSTLKCDALSGVGLGWVGLGWVGHSMCSAEERNACGRGEGWQPVPKCASYYLLF